MWSKGSRVPSYESKEGILNFRGRGWSLMSAVKGESVLWTKSSTGFALLIFSLISSMTLLIWSISFSRCGTLHEVVPLDWFSGSVFLELSCLVSSWFYRVNSTIAAAMDYTCWTEDGCMVGADWRSWRGLLEASLLSWGPKLVTLDLVRTISALYQWKKLQNSKKIKL